MRRLTLTPPVSAIEPITEVLHGVEVTDSYRWLEDGNSPNTRAWIEEQTEYARAYLDGIPNREQIRERIRRFLAIETCDSFLKAGIRYFFRKRLPGQEQPCIYVRDGLGGKDRLVLDPAERGTGTHTAVKPVQASPDGKLLLYEIKEGGERTGIFALVDIETRRTLSDVLARGYLRSFAFTSDSKGFYYVHECSDSKRPFYRAAYLHLLGTNFTEDQEIFYAGEGPNLRLSLTADRTRLCFVIYRFEDRTRTSFYVKQLEGPGSVECVIANAEYSFAPALIQGRILAVTDRDAPNLCVVKLNLAETRQWMWTELIPETDSRIHQWIIAGDRMLVSYIRRGATHVLVFDFDGSKKDEWPVRTDGRTVHFLAASPDDDQVLVQSESFTRPPTTLLCHARMNKFQLWANRTIPFDSKTYGQRQTWYASKDRTRIPIFLVGRRDVLAGGCHPAIMTSYGGYGIPMTPQFSVFVAFLLEHGCLFALPGIRGGADLGAQWHDGAKRLNRQVAYDDFLAAAEWLIQTGRTNPDKLAIFGGSNSGLLVGAALTQRPELFRAVVCIAPILDMLRYHLFDNAHTWRDEFGTADEPDEFAVLSHYSPYHQVRGGTAYPATMIVSGDADQNCNPLHARKMTARLQMANASDRPILLHYNRFRGHSPVLPLSERVEALTDRMAFLLDQLGLAD